MKRAASWITAAVEGTLHGPDVTITSSVQTDSREVESGSLYIARVGEEADGHTYVSAAAASGAVCAIVEQLQAIDLPQILVEDSTVALGALAAAYLRELRDLSPLSVIGITGSAGKTTTKDLLGQILATAGPTIYPVLSFNNEVGCPLTVLRATEETRYLVLEMGASGPGHLRYLTDIAPLDIATVLMVGTAHLGGFGSVEVLAQSKQELVQGLLPTGVAILNADDASVAAMSAAAPNGVRYFSREPRAGVELWAESIEIDTAGQPHFWLCSAKDRVHVDLTLVGEHQVSNALAAAASAQAAGLDLQAIGAAMGTSTRLSPHRMAVHPDVRVGPSSNILLIDDSYNANPDSMAAGLRTARRLTTQGRLVAVLGEMMELGQGADDLHIEVAQQAAQVGAEIVVAVGAGAAPVVRALESVAQTHMCADYNEALALIPTIVRTGDTLFLKGSLGSQVWRVADGILEDNAHSSETQKTEVIR